MFFMLQTRPRADTGNSCRHPGYDKFNPSSWDSECAPSSADWINVGVGMCGDGDAYPEEFWNCADIEITSGEGHTARVYGPHRCSSLNGQVFLWKLVPYKL